MQTSMNHVFYYLAFHPKKSCFDHKSFGCITPGDVSPMTMLVNCNQTETSLTTDGDEMKEILSGINKIVR